MSTYAKDTSVSVDNSRNDIERTLKRYGARQFAYASQDDKAMIMFQIHGKSIRFILNLPSVDEFKFTPGRKFVRTPEAQEREHEQACRSKWRALLLVIKAKLEAVEAGISIFEEEFLANILLPNQQTVAEFVLPQVENTYKSGAMPPMLPFMGDLK